MSTTQKRASTSSNRDDLFSVTGVDREYRNLRRLQHPARRGARGTTLNRTTTFQVTDNAEPRQTVHVILEATDNGTPALTRYQRVVIRAR